MLASYDPAIVARRLDLPLEVAQLYGDCDVVDLHLDTFIWKRILGYDLTKRHGRGLLGARLMWQVDVPRLREGGVTGALWSITTNPLRSARGRTRTLLRNLDSIKAELARAPDDVAVCRSLADYQAARAAGRHGAFIAIQGGNALDGDHGAVGLVARDVIRVTLVHLSKSPVGMTSAPSPFGRADEGLTAHGRELVRLLDEHRVFVDLAHVSRRGFFDAVEAHDPSLPLIVTHTGVNGVHPHWRNLDDEQIRAIARTGGVVGVMFQSSFLAPSMWRGRAASVVDHLEHIAKIAGDDVPALGSDFDGFILPPRDLSTCLELPRLVAIMLERGWSPDRVRKVLGANFLSSLGRLRPGTR